MRIRFLAPLGAFAVGSMIGTIAAIVAGYAVPGLVLGAIALGAIVAVVFGRSQAARLPADWRRLTIGNIEKLAREGGSAGEIDEAARAIAAAGYGPEAVSEFRELAAKALFARARGAMRPAREITP